jgi:hypothetical protein
MARAALHDSRDYPGSTRFVNHLMSLCPWPEVSRGA